MGGKARRVTKDNSTKYAEVRKTTVLFVEFTKGGMLQKLMREALDRVTPRMGFKVRVAEKGGTTRGSLLSNKNLWSGQKSVSVYFIICK